MKVLQLIKQKGTLYLAVTDQELDVLLDYEVLFFNHIQEGSSFTQERWDQIVAQELERQAKQKALNYVTAHDYASKALYDKLAALFPPEIAAKTTASMQEMGFVNDQVYAQRLAESYLTQKKWGRRRAFMEMQRKGVEKELAEQALEDCDVDVSQNIKDIIERKYRQKLEDPKERQKVIAGLARLGYSFGDILTAIRQIREE